VVEGLYSTSGDVAPLADIVATSREFGAYVLVDEAHSFGVFGARGLGCVESEDVLDEVDFIVGTFSKSLGGVGGFCVSSHRALALLHFTARAYLFTASSSPATIATVRETLDRLITGHELRARLWKNARYLRERLRRRCFTIGRHEAPIVAVHVGEAARAMALWSALLHEGVYVNLVLPPACPHGKARLRVSCTAAHSLEDIDELVARLDRAEASISTA
jgi:8-amino-7-oxononanoate synthase